MTLGKGYYAYVVVGLIAVAAITVVAGLSSENGTGEGVLPIAIGAVLAFVVGLLILQWRGVFKAEREGAEQAAEARAAAAAQGLPDDAAQVTSPAEMIELLAIEEVDPRRLERARRSQGGFMRVHMGTVTAVTLICIGLGYLGATGNLPNLGESGAIVFAPLVLAPLALGYVFWIMGRARGSGDDMLAPLGLRITDVPRPGVAPDPFRGSGMRSTVGGATVIQGRRHGREVTVVMDASRHRTLVGGKAPAFKLTAKGDRLRVDGEAPAAVAEAIGEIGPSKRWKKLRSVEGGDDGILATRRVDAGQSWLWDLWLAERLAERLG